MLKRVSVKASIEVPNSLLLPRKVDVKKERAIGTQIRFQSNPSLLTIGIPIDKFCSICVLKTERDMPSKLI